MLLAMVEPGPLQIDPCDPEAQLPGHKHELLLRLALPQTAPHRRIDFYRLHQALQFVPAHAGRQGGIHLRLKGDR